MWKGRAYIPGALRVGVGTSDEGEQMPLLIVDDQAVVVGTARSGIEIGQSLIHATVCAMLGAFAREVARRWELPVIELHQIANDITERELPPVKVLDERHR